MYQSNNVYVLSIIFKKEGVLMILKLILYAIIIFLSNILSYKIIRFIDKKERKYIQKWELNFIDSVKNDNSDVENDNSDVENEEELF